MGGAFIEKFYNSKALFQAVNYISDKNVVPTQLFERASSDVLRTCVSILSKEREY
jgi:hypothetical protein